MTLIAPRLAAMIIAGSIACATSANAAEDVVIVYDASGSMWGQIDGTSKIEIARDVMADLVSEWDTGTNLGLVAYGHRSQGDCRDIQTLIAPGPLDKSKFIDTVNSIRPVGKTPISAAVQHAADLLSFRDNPATVVLISDGVETCNADPCALSAQLTKKGVKFTAHVVGFDLKDEENASLSCIAENTGGVFVTANNAAELHDALAQVQSAMAEPSVIPEAKPEQPVVPEVEITAPEQATTGAAFDVAWSKTINGSDYITIVPAGADEGSRGNHIRAGSDREGSLRAPSEPGLYEVRYVLEEGKKTLAIAAVELVEAQVEITAPEQATTGAVFDVAWSKTINESDYITIVPAGADQGSRGNHIRAGSDREGSLRAPSEPGLYEVRYVLEEGKKTLAIAAVELVEAQVEITAPEQATTGAVFDVAWSKTINESDYITIVPAGADQGSRGNHIRAGSDREGNLRAPSEPGLYEVRYVLEEGKKTLAIAAVELVEAQVEITAPEQATIGAVFDVAWSKTINESDYITIVPAGADQGSRGNHIRAGSDREGSLAAPAEPGLYEVRYVLEEGKKTLATAAIELVEAEIGISGPGIVRAGTDVDITWSSTVNRHDYVTIVPAGVDEGARDTHLRTGDKTKGRLTAPTEPGLYEIRYVLEEGKKTLATAQLEVVPADAPLDGGAGLSVPTTASPGATITITWTGESDSTDQRIALARKDQPDFSWIVVQKVGAEKTMDMTMPDEIGVYEVRFLDIADRALLGRSVVEVK
ncbi:von Willebrand factor type A domain [Hoeflea sp. IMCC20628]|uniref:vWA domain-containing protein n=1 Tax=Hoeflea sp. IMCC20628 TaxID=1620421 RepID=UPI00063BDBD2|nr:VWA domain-containing protein [Hoeflea sp. IMCC20628]AKI01805.1 von Willebrand factor type A domain [Hoeflea sp. IMCC20628]